MSELRHATVIFGVLSLRLFKQHVYGYFQYLSDKEKQRKQYSDDTMNDCLKLLNINPAVTFFHHISASKDVNLPTHVPKLSCEGIHMNFPSRKKCFSNYSDST